MAVTFSDDFNRADGALGTDWVNLNGTKLVIVSNSVTSPDAGTNHTATVPSVASADAYSELTITTIGGSTSMGVGARLQTGSETGYMWRYNGTNCQLFSVSTGSFTAIGSAYTATLTAPFTLRIECEGTAIRGYVDGVLRASTTSSVTSGAGHGSCRLQGTGVRGDNFAMGTLATAATGTGALALSGSATAVVTAVAAAALALAGAATPQASDTASAALALAGSSSAAVSTGATGDLVLGAAATTGSLAPATGTAALTLHAVATAFDPDAALTVTPAARTRTVASVVRSRAIAADNRTRSVPSG